MKLRRRSKAKKQKQKAQLKGEAAAHLERGGTALLPGAARRNDREGSEDLKQMQALSEQIEQLETQRQQLHIRIIDGIRWFDCPWLRGLHFLR